jgi:hypothetical protein
MTALSDAKAHLDKARELLESARDEYDFERYSAAASAPRRSYRGSTARTRSASIRPAGRGKARTTTMPWLS